MADQGSSSRDSTGYGGGYDSESADNEGTGPQDEAAAAAKASGIDIGGYDFGDSGSQDDAGAYARALQSVQQSTFNTVNQISAKNPYGRQGFFSRVFGIDPKNISYEGIMSLDNRQKIAANQYNKYANPMRDLGQRPGTVRPGLSSGDMTAFGPVQSQYKEQTPQEMAARFGAGLLGGPFIGGILSQLGTKENVIAGLSPGFDPNNPRGPQGMLGQAASFLTGGVDPTQATAQAAAGIQRLRDRFAPSTPMPGVMPTSPPDRPAMNPDQLAGFEQRFNRPSTPTGVTRPQVTMTTTRGPGIESYFDEATPQSPVPGFSTNDPSTGFKENLMDAYLDSRERQITPTEELRQINNQNFGDRLSSSTIFPDVNRRQVGVLDDLGMAARQLGENIVAVPGGYMNTETGKTYSGQYNPNARARTFTGTQQPQGTAPFSFGSFIQNIVGQ